VRAPGPRPEHDVQREVLHRRVEHLLGGAGQPVHLVDEQHVVLLQVRQDRGEVAGALDGGTGGDAHGDAHLGGDDVGERGLAEAGRAVEEHVVQRLVALLRGLDGDAQVVLQPLLADELAQLSGPEGSIERLFVVLRLAGDDALVSGRGLLLGEMIVLVSDIVGASS
jgi:hypothetical protein